MSYSFCMYILIPNRSFDCSKWVSGGREERATQSTLWLYCYRSSSCFHNSGSLTPTLTNNAFTANTNKNILLIWKNKYLYTHHIKTTIHSFSCTSGKSFTKCWLNKLNIRSISSTIQFQYKNNHIAKANNKIGIYTFLLVYASACHCQHLAIST